MSEFKFCSDAKDVRSEELGREITELFGLITAATYDLLVKIREFDQQGLWQLPGLCSCAHWLSWQCGINVHTGREKIRVAHALADLPLISEAFRLGKVSYSKVRVMTRVARPDNEEYLMQIARYGTASHMETLIRGYRYSKKLNEKDTAEKQFKTRSLNYRWEEDGSLTFKGRLPAEVGAMLIKAIDSAVEHVDRGEANTDSTWEPIETRRADALAEMTESYLETGPAHSSSADRYQVMVHVSAETLPSGQDKQTDQLDQTDQSERGDQTGVPAGTSPNPDEECSHIENGPGISVETSRRICCDSSVSRILEDEEGEPLSIGRKSRVIPPAMRRALKARDKICRFPGCTHQYCIDGHHIQHWADGGETSLENLVQLCRFHHRLIHEGGFGCEKDKHGKVVFTDLFGDAIGKTGYQFPPCDNVVANLQEKLEDRHINSQTVVTEWEGELMDRHLAVGHLWAIDEKAERDGNNQFEN
jgi:uncharacterized protein DUF222/HNH endonuclease